MFRTLVAVLVVSSHFFATEHRWLSFYRAGCYVPAKKTMISGKHLAIPVSVGQGVSPFVAARWSSVSYVLATPSREDQVNIDYTDPTRYLQSSTNNPDLGPRPSDTPSEPVLPAAPEILRTRAQTTSATRLQQCWLCLACLLQIDSAQ